MSLEEDINIEEGLGDLFLQDFLLDVEHGDKNERLDHTQVCAGLCKPELVHTGDS